MKLKKLLTIFPLCFSLLFLSFSPVNAAFESHNTSKNIIQWGLDGGFTFSILVTLSSALEYTINSYPGYKTITYSLSDASLMSSSNHGLAACSTVLGVRKQTNFGSLSVNLPTQGSYIVAPGTSVIGFKSSGWSYTTDIPMSASVNNNGFAHPTPSKCIGGSSVDDDFVVSLLPLEDNVQ